MVAEYRFNKFLVDRDKSNIKRHPFQLVVSLSSGFSGCKHWNQFNTAYTSSSVTLLHHNFRKRPKTKRIKGNEKHLIYRWGFTFGLLCPSCG